MSVSFASAEDDTGFTGPFTTIQNWRMTDAAGQPPSSGVHVIAADGSNSFTDTGLTPDTYYYYRQRITPTTGSVRNTADADTPGGFTYPHPGPIVPVLVQIGDSRTGIGTPNSVTVMASTLASWLGLGSIVSTANAHAGGSLSTTWWDAVNHLPMTAFTDTIDDAETAGCTDFIIQGDVGVNDSFTAAFVEGVLEEMVAHLRTRAASDSWTSLKRIWVYPCLPRSVGDGADDVSQPSHDNQRAYQSLVAAYVAADAGGGGISVHMITTSLYDYLLVHPELWDAPDLIHQNQAGVNIMGEYVAWDLMAVVMGGLGTGSRTIIVLDD